MAGQRRPAYLVATHRSGTNLLRSLLGGHPEISAPAPFEETFPHTELPGLTPDRQRKYVRDLLICQKHCPHGLHEELRAANVCERMDEWSFYELQRALYEEYASLQGSSVWVTKYNGYHFAQVEDGVEFYDDLKVIYLVRDPRDVALSFKSASVGPYHPYMSSGRWTIEQSVGKRLLEDPDVDVHFLTYEDLLRTPDDELRDLCEFLGVEAVDEMLSHHERDEAEHMADNAHMFENLSKPILSDNYGKFRDRLPDEEVRIVEKVAREAMEYFGYDFVHSAGELDDFELRDREVYERRNEALRKEFKRQMWRDSTRELLRLRMWHKYKLFLHLRYSVLG